MTEVEPFRRPAVALAIGFLIGLERGWQTRDESDRERTAGLRTFALTGLLGGMSALAPLPLFRFPPMLASLQPLQRCQNEPVRTQASEVVHEALTDIRSQVAITVSLLWKPTLLTCCSCLVAASTLRTRRSPTKRRSPRIWPR